METMKRKSIYIPYRPEPELEAMADDINAKIGSYKSLHHKRTLLEALYEILKIVETGKEAIIDELKDLGKTFPNTPNKSYTGQQIHQVIDSRIKYQKERNE